MADPASEERRLTRERRRFARRQWTRRWLAWRVVLAAVLAVGAVAGGIWVVFFSPYLAVERTEVEGIRQLDRAEVDEAAAVPVGRPLARVDIARIEARVEALAIVADATASRAWPDAVRIEIRERRAVAVVEVGGRFRGMDAEGVLFRDFAAVPPALPRIVTGEMTRAEALQEAADVIAALPRGISREVDFVEVRTVDQIVLVLDDDRRVDWGSAEQSEQKARVLRVLLDQEARVYDVSVPGQPTTR